MNSSFLVLLSGFTAASFFDIRQRIIPDQIVFMTGTALILTELFIERSFSIWNVAGAIGIGLILLLVCFLTGGIGGGDVKLISVLALGTGFHKCAEIVALASLAGIIFSVCVCLVRESLWRKLRIPMAPFLSAGILLNHFYGEVL